VVTIIKGLLKGERLTFAGLPTASDIPAMRIVHQHSPSPLNPPSAMKAIPFTFDELEAHLSSDETPGDCMQLSDLDGFLRALVIPPSRMRALP